jgi:uncharacterized membrane protein
MDAFTSGKGLSENIEFQLRSQVGKTLNIHIIGNLVAVLLVSVHFAHQVTRSTSAYPDLGTGIVLYAAMMLLVATGILRYSGIGKRFAKQIIFLHPAFAVTFYMVIILHILHGISLI